MREISQGLAPEWASSTIFCRVESGSGRPETVWWEKKLSAWISGFWIRNLLQFTININAAQLINSAVSRRRASKQWCLADGSSMSMHFVMHRRRNVPVGKYIESVCITRCKVEIFVVNRFSIDWLGNCLLPFDNCKEEERNDVWLVFDFKKTFDCSTAFKFKSKFWQILRILNQWLYSFSFIKYNFSLCF